MWTGEVLVRTHPSYMGIDPSSICQLRCPLCPTGVENDEKKSGRSISFRERTFLNLEIFDSLIDELGEYLFLVMFYNWGEPLLNKELPAMIRKAKSFDIATEIHTNLSLPLTDPFIDDLLNSGIDDVAASLDGFSQATYQTYRRGGNFELAKNNIERLAKARDRLGLKTNIIWNFLVFSFNEHDIESTRKYCEQIGITFNRREAFIDRPEWLPSYRKGELDPNPTVPTASENAATQKRITTPCAWHYNYSMVNANGSISPCCAPWEQKHDFGLIQPGQIGFTDIWNNNLYRKSRGAFAGKRVKGLEKLDTLCLRCPYGHDIQNQYSFNDDQVRQRFLDVYQDTEPLLYRAFSLLENPQAFTEFFQANSIDNFATAPVLVTFRNQDNSPKLNRAETSNSVFRLPFSKTWLNQALQIWREKGLGVLIHRTWQYIGRTIQK
ncbi:MAG: radical SAM protein [Chloroflexi bacterium]|nr:radical SAM protein [Chloroflexota bacterium]